MTFFLADYLTQQIRTRQRERERDGARSLRLIIYFAQYSLYHGSQAGEEALALAEDQQDYGAFT